MVGEMGVPRTVANAIRNRALHRHLRYQKVTPNPALLTTGPMREKCTCGPISILLIREFDHAEHIEPGQDKSEYVCKPTARDNGQSDF